MGNRRRGLVRLAGGVCAASIASDAARADTYWQGPPGGTASWSVASNWTNGLPGSPGGNPYIDNGGIVSFNTNYTLGFLELGSQAGTSGGLEVRGGKLDVAVKFIVGNAGTGTVTHSGGTVGTNLYALTLGATAGASGHYTLENTGSITTKYEHVGGEGGGRFDQTGGTHTVEELNVAFSNNATGTYALSGGTLSTMGTYLAGYTSIGNTSGNPSATFVQTGGAHNVTFRGLYVGIDGPASYRLDAGTLAANSVQVGHSSAGTFVQNGGTINTSFVGLGRDGIGNGAYAMTAGTVNTSDLWVGAADFGMQAVKGSFTQSGGTAAVTGTTLIGRRGADTGNYTISGGRLSTARLLIGEEDNARATFAITDPAAHVTVSESIRIGRKGVLSAVPGAVIHMTGSSFDNGVVVSASQAGASDGMSDLTFVFEGGNATPDPFEVAGLDGGGFDNNFGLHKLQIGGANFGNVRLFDAFDTQDSWNGTEVLYVDILELGPGSTLDLNGRKLYCAQYINSGGSLLLNGGTLVQVPEPAGAAMLLLASGLATLGRRR